MRIGTAGEKPSRDEPSARHSPEAYIHGRVWRKWTAGQSPGPRPPAIASRGFTLIELIVVIGIMAIMTVASFPGITNSLETRALDGAARDVLMSLQTAKWKAAADTVNCRVRVSQVGTSWKYAIEREATAGTWTTAPGTVQKSIPSKFGVTLTLPTTKDVIFTPMGFVSNCDSTKNSIMISSSKLASLSQQSNRTVRFYTGGSIQFLKS